MLKPHLFDHLKPLALLALLSSCAGEDVQADDDATSDATTAVLSRSSSSVTAFRYANCPKATRSVSTDEDFRAALRAAKPGTVIFLQPGVYYGDYTLRTAGTAAAPIWICGSRSAILEGGSLDQFHPILLESVSHVVITGFTVRNAMKGVTVVNSSHVTVSDLYVSNIGHEGIHLRGFTTDSDVIGNTIRKTGLIWPLYGEGVYIGTSSNNWCRLTNCKPDKSDRNRILDNTISLTGAQEIEAKEGTTGGLIDGNVFDGTAGVSVEDEWVLIKGNNWTISNNRGLTSRLDGYGTNASVDGWAMYNVFTKNSATVNAQGYGFRIHHPASRGPLGNVVKCDNVVVRAAAGFSNQVCQR